MDIKTFYLQNSSIFYNNRKIRNGIFSYKEAYGFNEKNSKELFIRILISLLEEAQLTISLIPNMKKSILEIGGGVGLVYGFLKAHGINIASIEPGERGYDKSYKTGIEILNELHIDSSGWFKYKAEDLEKLNKKFDLIVSNNVLEHIPKIEDAIVAMKNVLSDNGSMIHSCPNYLIPYECHYKLWLIPFFPKYSEFLYPSLKNAILWSNINFISSFKIKRICNDNNFLVNFKKETMYDAFERLETNSEFRIRQKNLWLLYVLFKKVGLLNIFKYIPGELSTPMTFIAKPKSL